MSRCEAITRRGKQCTREDVPLAAPHDAVTLCSWHIGIMRDRRPQRLTGNRQARIAVDVAGNNPEVRVATLGLHHDVSARAA